MSILLAAAAAFSCQPVAVWDGDGPIHCQSGEKVRLADLAARELDGTCRPGHPCPDASGTAARDYLVRLLGGAKGRWSTGHIEVSGPALSCRKVGTSYGRTVARCRLPNGTDLTDAMVASGLALSWPH